MAIVAAVEGSRVKNNEDLFCQVQNRDNFGANPFVASAYRVRSLERAW